MTTLEYNTERPHLHIPEYGRHIQKMIEKAVLLEDRNERNRTARSIIAVMGNLFPHLRDVPDFQHKLWDQLFIMSGFSVRCRFSLRETYSLYPTQAPRPLRISTTPTQISILWQYHP